MEILTCGRGHYYNPELYSSCPECARERNMPETEFDSISSWQTCPRGHMFDASFYVNCPYCREEGPVQGSWPWREKMTWRQESLTEAASLGNTLIFAAFGNLSYQIWCQSAIWYLTVRAQLAEPWPVLEKTVTVSVEEINRSVGKILQELFDCNAQTELKGHECDPGDIRLRLNTRQLFCDYRGSFGKLSYPVSHCTQIIHAVLGALFEKNQKEHYEYHKNRENLVAEVEYSTTNCSLWRSAAGYTLEVRDITYYDFTQSFSLWETVRIPADAGEQLVECLAECGAMEALIQKSMRPDDMIYRDPATATVFYLRNRGLTYSYRDWDKDNGLNESSALSKAMQEMLACFMYYRDGSVSMPDMTILLP